MRLLAEGKVKRVHEVDSKTLEFEFTDNISVFDKVIPTQIPGKGESLCRTSAYWFQRVEQIGIRTHFLGTPAPNRMRVRRMLVEPDAEKLRAMEGGYLIPLEFIMRHYLAGSLHDKVRAGKVSFKELGFAKAEDAAYGAKLPSPLFEVTTKLEPVDRKLTIDEGMAVGGLEKEEMQNIHVSIIQIDDLMAREVAKHGLVHADGKKEFGYSVDGELMLLDTFGTADEDRFWEADELAKGKVVDRSKEVVRQHYRETGYHAKLMEAREKGLPEPPIPPLPEKLAGEVSTLYKQMYERLTGRKF